MTQYSPQDGHPSVRPGKSTKSNLNKREAERNKRPVIMNTTFYAEYHNYGVSLSSMDFPCGLKSSRKLEGPGANISMRVSDHILTSREAANFTLENVFHGRPSWVDFDYRVSL